MNRYGNENCDWLANILMFVSLRSVTTIIPHAKKVHHLKASFATFSNFFLSNIFVVLDVIFWQLKDQKYMVTVVWLACLDT